MVTNHMAAPVLSTKHFKVSKLLGEQIRFLSPGEMIPTVAELKEQYEASQATITQALERLRQQGIIERPAGKKRLVVARIGARPDFRVTLIRPLWSSPDYDSITNHIYELGLKENFGFGVHIYSSINDLNLEHALQNSDAGIVLGDLQMGADQVKAFNGSRKPVVFLRDKPAKVQRDSVWVDDVAVGRLATQHLQKLGHSRILVMLSEPSNPSSTARMQGWKQAMEKRGTAKFEQLISDCSVPSGTDSLTGSYHRFGAWLDSRKGSFTAVFCTAWTGALAVLRTLRERNIRVPEDVSVITFASELPLCDFTAPALTAMEMDVERYTREAMRLVTKHLRGTEYPVKPENIRLTPTLVQRGSTGPARR